MTPVVVDASALAALVFREPGFERITARLEGATVVAPALLKFELANVAVVKARRHRASAVAVFAALAMALSDQADIVFRDVDATDVALLAQAAGITAYDASYVWLAGTLNADLVTLDQRLIAALARLEQTA